VSNIAPCLKSLNETSKMTSLVELVQKNPYVFMLAFCNSNNSKHSFTFDVTYDFRNSVVSLDQLSVDTTMIMDQIVPINDPVVDEEDTYDVRKQCVVFIELSYNNVILNFEIGACW